MYDSDQSDVTFHTKGFKLGRDFIELFPFVTGLIGYDYREVVEDNILTAQGRHMSDLSDNRVNLVRAEVVVNDNSISVDDFRESFTEFFFTCLGVRKSEALVCMDRHKPKGKVRVEFFEVEKADSVTFLSNFG